VADKNTATFCEYFDFARREWVARGANSREDDARAKLRQLLGE
jgi:hypothetical protein